MLLIEDEPMVSWWLQEMLTFLGCVVVGPAAGVEEALTAMKGEAIEASVLDINLNGRRSYAVADALVAQHVPFVFATGYHGQTVLEGYRHFPILQKPFRRADLGAALSRLLS